MECTRTCALKVQKIQVGISGLEYSLLGPGEELISIMALAENARDECGTAGFAVIETSRGIEVAVMKLSVCVVR